MFNLEKTPYLLDEVASGQVRDRLDAIEERVSLLRRAGTLNDQTLRDYYGEKRFEQVAESNAIEGSTLSVGETELAVLKGITITGHDPAYTKDAIALDRKPSVIRREISMPLLYPPLRTHFTSPEEIYGFHFPAGSARSQTSCRSLAHHPSLHS